MSDQNTAIVQQAYTNFKTGDIPGLLDLLSDEVTWELPEIEGVAITGKRNGRDGVKEFFATLAREQEVVEFEPSEFVAQDDKVVSLGHYEWRVKDTGRNFASYFAHVFTVRDGKITGFREFMDSAAVASAYRKAMSA